MPPPHRARATYHHGALRETLVAACLDLIKDEGIGAVSLRRVAREAGVSPGAPYHHFADRAELLAAISEQGTRLLEERLVAARACAPSAVSALTALIEAYVRFAHEQPAYFRLTCRPELLPPAGRPVGRSADGPPVLADGSSDAAAITDCTFRLLSEVVQDCQREGALPTGSPAPWIGLVWALGHGLACLWLDGPLEVHGRQLAGSPEALVGQVADGLRTILGGLRPE